MRRRPPRSTRTDTRFPSTTLCPAADRVPPLAVNLTKTLPVAAGIGGGAADAAAMARLVRRHFLPDIGDATLARIVSPLGADIAACVASATCLGVGVGEELSAVPELRLAGTPMLLVHPDRTSVV